MNRTKMELITIHPNGGAYMSEYHLPATRKSHDELFAIFTASPQLLEAAQLLLKFAHANWESLECGSGTIPLRARLGKLHEVCESIKAVQL